MTHLAREIAQQPEAISRLTEAMASDLPRLRQHIGTDVDHVVVVARGSSDNAARYAQYLFAVQHRLPVALATPSVLSLYGVQPRLPRTLVVAVSQSGRSPDVVETLAAARDQGRPAVAITNDPESPLAAAASYVIDLRAGPERSVAATKTYTTSLTAIALLSLALAEPDVARDRLAHLRAVPHTATAVLKDTRAAIGDVGIEKLATTTHLVVTGRGLNYATAFEAALKLRELTGIVTEPFSPPDLLHGPIAALDEATAVLLIAPTEPSLTDQHRLLSPLRDRGARLAAVSGDRDLLAQVDDQLPLVAEPVPWLTPITTILPVQVLAERMSRHRGLDPDRPGGLTKVTTTR